MFEELPAAAVSLRAIAQAFSPGAIISHAYEGAHIDHEACSFLATHVAAALALPHFEFPLYWLDQLGKPVLQRFRDVSSSAQVMEWQLTPEEVECKRRMMAEYHTQRGTVSTFSPLVERMRPAVTTTQSFSTAWSQDYMFQERRPRFYHTRRHRLAAKVLLKKFAEFEIWRQGQPDWRRNESPKFTPF